MKIRLNQSSLNAGMLQVTEQLAQACVDVAKDNLRVDTGRMASSTRHSPPALVDGNPTSTITVGGVNRAGIYRESGQTRFVDYAATIEGRFGDTRKSVIPRIMEEAAFGALLDYELQRQELG